MQLMRRRRPRQREGEPLAPGDLARQDRGQCRHLCPGSLLDGFVPRVGFDPEGNPGEVADQPAEARENQDGADRPALATKRGEGRPASGWRSRAMSGSAW